MRVILTASLLGTVLLAGGASCKASEGQAALQGKAAKDLYARLIAMPPDERRTPAAAEVDALASMLPEANEEAVSYIADVLEMAGCEASPALPALSQVLSRLPSPGKARGDGLLSIIAPTFSGHASVERAIEHIEADRRCDRPVELPKRGAVLGERNALDHTRTRIIE